MSDQPGMIGESAFHRHGKTWVSAFLRLYLVVLIAMGLYMFPLLILNPFMYAAVLGIISICAFGCVGSGWYPAIKARQFYFNSNRFGGIIAEASFFLAIIMSASVAHFIFDEYNIMNAKRENLWTMWFVASATSHVVIQVFCFLPPGRGFRHLA